MKGFKRTTSLGTGRGAHSHLAYISEESGSGLTSNDAGHAHQLIYQPPKPAGVDPMTGMPTPATPGRWIVQPGADGHSHELSDFIVKPKKKKESDEEIVKEVYHLFRAAKQHEQESRDKAQESEDFYCGDQWPKDVKAELEASNRAAVTINMIQKSMDELSGHQRQQRQDLKYVPPEDGDQRVADILNHVSKHIFERCFFSREESKVFEDEGIVGRGNFCFSMDFERSLQGDLKISRFPWDDVVYGPHEMEDLSDCEHLHKHKLYSKAKLKQLFPDKADDIEGDYKLLCEFQATGKPTIDHAGDEYAAGDGKAVPLPLVGDLMMYDIANKEFRLIECQRKVYERRTIIIFADDDFYHSADGWDKKDIERAKTIEGFQTISKSMSKIRVSKVCGSTLLEDGDSEIDDYDIVPVYAKKRGKKWWGKVELVKDPQKEINKRHSQAIDIGNKMCAYGWAYDEDTFPDPAEADRFKKNAATPGFVTKLNNTERPPLKFEGMKFPGELVQLMALGADQIKGLMNIQPDEGGANTSGFALMQRLRQKLVGNDFLFDNLSFAKKKIGRLLVKYIQKYYDAQRIYRIVQNRNKKQPVQLGGQPMEKYPEEEIIELLQRTDLSEYDVEISESAYSPTVGLATAAVLSELAKTGFPVPPPMLIRLMDIPEEMKNEFAQLMQQQMQGQAQAEQAKQMSELLKPLMKPLLEAGVVPPMVQQALQGAAPQQPVQNEGQQSPAPGGQ